MQSVGIERPFSQSVAIHHFERNVDCECVLSYVCKVNMIINEYINERSRTSHGVKCTKKDSKIQISFFPSWERQLVFIGFLLERKSSGLHNGFIAVTVTVEKDG